MAVFRMCRTFFVLLKCTIQGGPKVDVLLIAFLHLWLKFWDGIDKYCIKEIIILSPLVHVQICNKTSVATGVSLVNIRLLPLTSDF